MSERRYLAPLPLGGDEGPPWSKGLLSRALAATGLGASQSYELARRADADLAVLDASHLFPASTTAIGIPRGAYLKGYVYSFIELFAPHLTREVVDEALRK